MRNRIVVLISLFLLASVAWSQQQPAASSAPSERAQQNMPGHDMSNMNMQ